MVVLGVLLLIVGLPLAVAPHRAMGAAAALRPLPLPADPSERQVLAWRRCGALAVAVAVIVLALA